MKITHFFNPLTNKLTLYFWNDTQSSIEAVREVERVLKLELPHPYISSVVANLLYSVAYEGYWAPHNSEKSVDEQLQAALAEFLSAVQLEALQRRLDKARTDLERAYEAMTTGFEPTAFAHQVMKHVMDVNFVSPSAVYKTPVKALTTETPNPRIIL